MPIRTPRHLPGHRPHPQSSPPIHQHPIPFQSLSRIPFGLHLRWPSRRPPSIGRSTHGDVRCFPSCYQASFSTDASAPSFRNCSSSTRHFHYSRWNLEFYH
ncbi:hypothetical protein CsSME_00028613 [Camellia sinensis var. sinensis]